MKQIKADDSIEQIKQLLSGKYTTIGLPESIEYRTTLELQYEFQEILSISESSLIRALSELEYPVVFLDGKPHWALYVIQEEE